MGAADLIEPSSVLMALYSPLWYIQSSKHLCPLSYTYWIWSKSQSSWLSLSFLLNYSLSFGLWIWERFYAGFTFSSTFISKYYTSQKFTKENLFCQHKHSLKSDPLGQVDEESVTWLTSEGLLWQVSRLLEFKMSETCSIYSSCWAPKPVEKP